jgi:hypothetical protein
LRSLWNHVSNAYSVWKFSHETGKRLWLNQTRTDQDQKWKGPVMRPLTISPCNFRISLKMQQHQLLQWRVVVLICKVLSIWVWYTWFPWQFKETKLDRTSLEYNIEQISSKLAIYLSCRTNRGKRSINHPLRSSTL